MMEPRTYIYIATRVARPLPRGWRVWVSSPPIMAWRHSLVLTNAAPEPRTRTSASGRSDRVIAAEAPYHLMKVDRA